MPKLIKALVDMTWTYPRVVSTATVQAVAVVTTLLARRLLPRSWRPAGAVPVVIGSAGAYVTLRLGAHTGWSKRFKHTVLDAFGGDVDDAQTWMLGTFAGGGLLVLVQLIRRGIGVTVPR
jgi:hypothetical protein